MRIDLNKYQRTALLVAAVVIVLVQFVQFSDNGVKGYGWIFSFLVAGVLVVVAFAKGTLSELAKAPVAKVVIPGKEELEIAHGALRENAEILAVEVEQRANHLASTLIKEKDDMTKGLVHTVQGSRELGDKFVEQLNMHIHERCTYLMLGLVGMRRAKGNKMYITGIEFKALQEKISKKLIEMAVATQTIMPISPEINTEALSKSVVNDLQQVRKAVTSYCIALESNNSEPEGAMLDWFESKCGLKLKGNSHVAQALRQERA